MKNKETAETIIICVLAFLLMFVGWPLAAMYLADLRWKAEWNAGKVVSQDSKQICKEVEYCAPCSPIHHWHKKVFCEPVNNK